MVGKINELLEIGINDFLILPAAPHILNARLTQAERQATALEQQKDSTKKKSDFYAVARKKDREQIAFQSQILSNLNDAVIATLYPEQTVVYWNTPAERQYGIPQEQALGRHIAELFKHEYLDGQTDESVAQLLLSTGSWRGPNKVHLNNGKTIFTESSVMVMRDENNEPRGTITLVRDTTEKVKAETALAETQERLRQAQKMEAIGQLAGGIAHDFNNLLMIIQGHAEMMLRRNTVSDPIRKYGESILQASQRAADLTRQLLTFSRKSINKPEVLDLNPLVEEAGKMLSRVIPETIQLDFQCDPDLGFVRADKGQLHQVLTNLAVNARDAMQMGGRLTIRTSNIVISEAQAQPSLGFHPGKYVMLSVLDTGVGMDKETRERIFEPFFTTKGQGKGTGLGLAMVYGIVEQNGGHIAVSSEPGKGSVFQVFLPRVDDMLAPVTSVSQRIQLPRGNETILLAEDEDGVRILVKDILEEYGYTVHSARNGVEALKLFEEKHNEIQLLITDVVMPGMNGRQLAEKALTLNPKLKVLYTSGYTDDTVLQHGVINAGMEFMQKPYSPESLAKKARKILDSSKKRHTSVLAAVR
jgi:PAS domain S-box-containing protein